MFIVTDSMRSKLAKFRVSMEALLLVCLAILGWQYNRKAQQLREAQQVASGLAAGLSQQLTIANGQIEVLKKQKDGKTVYQRVFVPPEGSIVVKEKDWSDLQAQYQSLKDQLAKAVTPEERQRLLDEISKLLAQMAGQGTITTEIKDKGFCFKPGFGYEYSAGFSPRLDIKFGFFKRYSALIGGGRGGADVSLSRHIDDIVWGKPQNVEVFAGYRIIRIGGAYYVFGLRSNF
jgi:hypothetical protein